MNPLQHNRVINVTKAIDRADYKSHHGNKAKGPDAITDVTALTNEVTADGTVVVKRTVMDALGKVRTESATANGLVANLKHPQFYHALQHWINTGKKPHPTFTPQLWRATQVKGNLVPPTGRAILCQSCRYRECKCTRKVVIA